MYIKKPLKSAATIISAVAVGGAAYVFVEKILSSKSLEADDKSQYVSNNSKNDEFISETVIKD